MNGSLRPERFVGVETDEIAIRAISDQLAQLSEIEKLGEIEPLLLHDSHLVQNVGLSLVEATLTAPEELAKVLEIAFFKADASRMRKWLEVLVPKMGIGSVLSAIRENLSRHPEGSDAALYWIPWITSGDDEEMVAEYKRVIAEARRLGVVRDPKPIPVYKT